MSSAAPAIHHKLSDLSPTGPMAKDKKMSTALMHRATMAESYRLS